MWVVAFYVLIKSAFVGKEALNLSKRTVKQKLKQLKITEINDSSDRVPDILCLK
jgi:hypothetical protein